MSPMKAIREKCLDCCVWQTGEVRLCQAVQCALWPFRAGIHPYTSARMKNPLQQVVFQEEGPAEAATSPSHGSTNPHEGN